MNGSDIVVKTAAGLDELKSRSRGLTQRLRAALILADGEKTVDQLRAASAGLGLPPDFLQGLISDGLVEVRSRGPGRGAGSGPASRPAPLTTVDIPTAGPAPAPIPPAANDAERFLRTREYINDRVMQSLGMRAYFFVLKLEKCSTVADLAALLPDFEKAIGKASGTDAADVMTAKARDLLR